MKKYTILKTFELPDTFTPNTIDCETCCPFRFYVNDAFRYEENHHCCCPFTSENGWACRINDVTEDDEFVHFTEKEAVEYKDSLMKAYKPTRLNIFDDVDITNVNEDEYIEAMDKAKELVYEATKRYIPDQIPNIYEMRDATPEEEKGVTDYIHSIAEPTGIKFDEVKENE